MVYENGGIASVTLAGKPLEPRKDYAVAFESGAVDAPDSRGLGSTARDLLARYIRTKGTVRGVLDARVQKR